MERHPRSLAARGFILSLALLLLGSTAGCSGRAYVQVNGQGVPPPSAVPGLSVSGGSVSANVQGGSLIGALLGIGALYAVSRGTAPREPLPALDATRTVNEQDCTQPITDWSANLRCR